jgi:hypothetical protein|tara:strand:- start:505 stop:627 length:123 start_codon:yes stop_codon:yes gene_type:complete
MIRPFETIIKKGKLKFERSYGYKKELMLCSIKDSIAALVI